MGNGIAQVVDQLAERLAFPACHINLRPTRSCKFIESQFVEVRDKVFLPKKNDLTREAN